VDVLRTLFLDDLESRPMTHDKQTGSLVDRTGSGWMIFAIDGTREAARQRALPKAEDLPEPFRRLDEVCAPGYKGRKRGEVVRTRTTVSQAHSYQWLGSFGAPLATGDTERNWGKRSRPLVAISRHTNSHKNTSCCGLMANTAPGRCSPIWPALPL